MKGQTKKNWSTQKVRCAKNTKDMVFVEAQATLQRNFCNEHTEQKTTKIFLCKIIMFAVVDLRIMNYIISFAQQKIVKSVVKK